MESRKIVSRKLKTIRDKTAHGFHSFGRAKKIRGTNRASRMPVTPKSSRIIGKPKLYESDYTAAKGQGVCFNSKVRLFVLLLSIIVIMKHFDKCCCVENTSGGRWQVYHDDQQQQQRQNTCTHSSRFKHVVLMYMHT